MNRFCSSLLSLSLAIGGLAALGGCEDEVEAPDPAAPAPSSHDPGPDIPPADSGAPPPAPPPPRQGQ